MSTTHRTPTILAFRHNAPRPHDPRHDYSTLTPAASPVDFAGLSSAASEITSAILDAAGYFAMGEQDGQAIHFDDCQCELEEIAKSARKLARDAEEMVRLVESSRTAKAAGR